MKIEMPNDFTIERIVLLGMLNEVDSVNEAIDSLSEKDFYFDENKILFNSMIDLAKQNKEISLFSLLTYLQERELFKSENRHKIVSDFMSESPSHEEFHDCIAPLKALSNKRELILLAQKMTHEIDKCKGSPDDLLIEYQKEICLIGQENKRKEIKSNKSLYENFMDGLSLTDYYKAFQEKIEKGLPVSESVSTGYKALDAMLGGFAKGSLTYIGARTSMGKTSFILNLMLKQLFCENPKNILFFSLEMPATTLFKKFACAKAGIHYDMLDFGKCSKEELSQFMYYSKLLSEKNLIYEDQTSLKISQVKARARRLHASNKIDIIYIDYITKIKPDSKHANNHLNIDEVSKGLQDLALELNIPVVSLAQLNRGVESRQDKEPLMSDFRECGSIEEDADNILLLFRPSYYDKNNYPGLLEVDVAKNRIMGNLGKVNFAFMNGLLTETKTTRKK